MSKKGNNNNSVHSNAHSETTLEHGNNDLSVHLNAHITDEATGEVVEITQEMHEEALKVHGQIEGAFWQIANALHRMVEEKLYLGLNYSSFNDYCADTLPWKARQAYDYALAGAEFGVRLIASGDSEKAGKIERLGISKIKLLASKASNQVERLIKEGKITIGDRELTDEDLANQTVKDLRDQLNRVNDKAARAELLEEQKKNTEMANEVLEGENNELKKWKQEHLERAKKQDDIKEAIEKAALLHAKMNSQLMKLGAEEMFEVATEDQRQYLVGLLDTINDRVVDHKTRHADLIEMIYDAQIDSGEEAIIDNIITKNS